ncbi:F-box family protein [Striga asiatica]|uniref:F-box family protein n=1 Tax=Striga asiatica TaxID=4170 RepID=A0A5A7PP96_STRAF|nr:F-box family protein [Striga asiatica]
MKSIAPIVLSTWLTLLTYRIFEYASSRRRRKQIQIRHHPQYDVIGDLPDSVLISILTRLPVEEAVRTSVLSKRWTSLYKFVADLDLRCHHLLLRRHHPPPRPSIFDTAQDMVQVCMHHYYNIDISFSTGILDVSSKYFDSRRCSKIRSLVFCCCLSNSYYRSSKGMFLAFVKYLANTAQVQKLVFQCCCRSCSISCLYFLPWMPGLRYLEFHSSISTAYSPNLYTNNSLRSLRLSKVTLREGALDIILSSCLGLCYLRMNCCEFPSSSRLCICGPNLRLEYLNIDKCIGVQQIKLCASNLVTFEFRSRIARVELVFEHVPRLQSMYYDGFQRDIMYDVRVSLSFVLPPNQLKSLTLDTAYDIYQVSTPGRINTYSNLRQLRLRISRTAYTSMLLGIIPFLQSCPLLHEFHLDTEFVKGDGPNSMRPETAETHSQLKKVEITGFCGSRNEIDFALYILENAICLEQMQISRCPKWHVGFDRWLKCEHKPRWSQQTRENICQQLQGRSLSETARVIIRHSPTYDDTWSRRKTDYDTHFL